MDTILAVVDETETGRQLVAEAGSIASGVDAKLIVLNVVDAAEYADEVKRAATRGERTNSADELAEQAERDAAAFAETVFDENGLDVDYEAVGLVGELPDSILSEARARECDHVFVAGRHRSPTGKVIFGDTAQSVVLNFDGPVTVRLDDA